jgi:hypothetical protein
MDPDSDPVPAIFVIYLQEANKSKKVTKQYLGIKVFLTIIAWSELLRRFTELPGDCLFMQQKQNQTPHFFPNVGQDSAMQNHNIYRKTKFQCRAYDFDERLRKVVFVTRYET